MTPEDLPTPGRTVTLTGVPAPAVEAGGLLLDGHLLVGGPRELLGSGRPVRVTGRVQPDLLTVWQQGIPLVVERAEPVEPAEPAEPAEAAQPAGPAKPEPTAPVGGATPPVGRRPTAPGRTAEPGPE
jgi:hypothetical protein